VPDTDDPHRVPPREIEPPPALWERVVATLRARGRLRPRYRPVVGVSAGVAAAALLLIVGSRRTLSMSARRLAVT